VGVGGIDDVRDVAAAAGDEAAVLAAAHGGADEAAREGRLLRPMVHA
jgi:hypothetical protein